MFSKLIAVAAIAGLAVASPQSYNAGDGFVQTITTFTTQEITVTSCGPEVTYCPARTTVYPVTQVITPAGAVTPNANGKGVNPTGMTGTGIAGGYGGNSGTYNVPQPTGGYRGPSYTGAGNKKSVAGGAALAVGAVAALLI